MDGGWDDFVLSIFSHLYPRSTGRLLGHILLPAQPTTHHSNESSFSFQLSITPYPTPSSLTHHILHFESLLSDGCGGDGGGGSGGSVKNEDVCMFSFKLIEIVSLGWWMDARWRKDVSLRAVCSCSCPHTYTHIVRRLDSCACFYSNTDWGLGGVLLAAAGRSGYWERSYPSSLATRWWWWAEFKGRN